MTTIDLWYSRIRAEEKLLLETAEREGIPVRPRCDEDEILALDGNDLGDVVLSRSVSTTRGLYLLRACRAAGVPSVNRYETAAVCADKADTSLRLRAAGVPTPDTRIAFGTESAVAAMEQLGYPVVLKPTQGSWARLIARVDDRDQAVQLLEHRAAIPNAQQHIYYVQQYVDTRNGTVGPDGAPLHHDVRAFVVGDRTICAIERQSTHWITNTARGGEARDHPVTDALHDICQRATEAVTGGVGGVLAVDLLETPDGYTVTELNHTMEFRNSIAPTGVDIPLEILRFTQEEARR